MINNFSKIFMLSLALLLLSAASFAQRPGLSSDFRQQARAIIQERLEAKYGTPLKINIQRMTASNISGTTSAVRGAGTMWRSTGSEKKGAFTFDIRFNKTTRAATSVSINTTRNPGETRPNDSMSFAMCRDMATKEVMARYPNATNIVVSQLTNPPTGNAPVAGTFELKTNTGVVRYRFRGTCNEGTHRITNFTATKV